MNQALIVIEAGEDLEPKTSTKIKRSPKPTEAVKSQGEQLYPRRSHNVESGLKERESSSSLSSQKLYKNETRLIRLRAVDGYASDITR